MLLTSYENGEILWVLLCRMAESTDTCAGLYKECYVLTTGQNALWTLLQYAVGMCQIPTVHCRFTDAVDVNK